MIWFFFFVTFLLTNTYWSCKAFYMFEFMSELNWAKGFLYWLQFIIHTETVQPWLLLYWFVWLFWFVPRVFWGFLSAQTRKPVTFFFYLIFFYVSTFFIFYIFWSFTFWLNLNVFVDYSVFSTNIFLIFFFNFVYSIFFKLTSLEFKVFNLLN